MIGKQHVYVSEVSEVNPGEQSLVMRSKNVSFNDILTIEEHIEYRADPTNPERFVVVMAWSLVYAWSIRHVAVKLFSLALILHPSRRTTMKHECQISVNLFGMSYLEGQVTKSIGANAAKGRLALEHVINAIETEVRGFSDNITVRQRYYYSLWDRRLCLC